MSNEDKTEFIRLNRHLPLEELSQKTGLRKRKVQKIIEKLQTGAGSPAAVPDMPKANNLSVWVLPARLALVTFLFYLPILWNGFVFSDDPNFILENPHIRSFNWASLQWMWTTWHTGNWIPLTWISLALDYQWGGPNPGIFHFTSLMIHVFNTVMVFFLCRSILNIANAKMRESSPAPALVPPVQAAFLATLLFALHPIHVESVAWAAERRDVLCSFFTLASLLMYLNYAASPGGKVLKLGACFLFFIMALLSKPMAVTLPFLLLLIDAWPLRRLRSEFSRTLLEKIPFFIASLTIGIVTILAQAGEGAMSVVEGLTPAYRIMNAFHSLVFYVWKMVIPTGLSPFYPIVDPQHSAFSAPNLASAFLVVLVSYLCFHYRSKPYLAVAWLYYVVSLAPALGIIQVGSQAAGDRFTYLPSLSLLILFSACLSIFLARKKNMFILFNAVLCVLLGALTVGQLKVWKNDVTMWEKVVKHYPGVSQLAHQNLGEAYSNAGRPEYALREFDRGLAIPTPNAILRNGKGRALLYQGRIDEAVMEFKTALAMSPNTNNSTVYKNLWYAYEQKGMHEEALAEIQEAVKKDPKFTDAYRCMGLTYSTQKQYKKSQEAFKAALSLEPSNVEYFYSLGAVYQLAGQVDEAIELFRKGIGVNPREPVFYLGLGKALIQKQDYSAAVEALQTAARFSPPIPELFNSLGLAYEKLGQKELATQYYEKARALASGVARNW